MYQSISTRYKGPTNYRGSRIIARSSSGHRLAMPYRCELDSPENHVEAAMLLAIKLKWAGPWYGGSGPNETGYVFVNATKPDFIVASEASG